MKEEKKEEEKNWLEWLITGISSVIVLFTLGFMVHQIIYEDPTPPNLQITLGETTAKDSGFAIPVTIHNEGTKTAENVVIAVFSKNGDAQEKAEITVQFLPGKSTAEGWVTFMAPPKDLETHVVGYVIP